MKENQLNKVKIGDLKIQFQTELISKKCCGDCKNNGTCNDSKKEHISTIKK